MQKEKCLLLFSGGRDSTVSAVLLSNEFDSINLITIKSVHLYGLKDVYKRLEELQPLLKKKCKWELYEKIENIELKQLKETTCLPCHAYYIALLQRIAVSRGIKNISLGYVGYQNCWEEQSEIAKKALKNYFEEIGLNLILPVETIINKDNIKNKLREYGLTESALEQKCLKAGFNVPLNSSDIKDQVEKWISSIKETYTALDNKFQHSLIDHLIL